MGIEELRRTVAEAISRFFRDEVLRQAEYVFER